MEKPIQQDKAFLKAMYDRYSYLQDFPCEFKGMFIEEALSLGTLHSDEFLGLLIAYPTEEEILTRDHFPYLPPEVNLKLSITFTPPIARANYCKAVARSIAPFIQSK
jgi:hypothetical protein